MVLSESLNWVNVLTAEREIKLTQVHKCFLQITISTSLCSKQTINKKRFNCGDCNKLILTTFFMRNETHNTPIWKTHPIETCKEASLSNSHKRTVAETVDYSQASFCCIYIYIERGEDDNQIRMKSPKNHQERTEHGSNQIIHIHDAWLWKSPTRYNLFPC